MELHQKSYSSLEEKQARFNIFVENYEHLYHLQRTEEGTAVYSYLSPFSDMSPEVFSARNGFLYSAHGPSTAPVDLLDASDLAAEFDWVAKGAVNPVKNQGGCGSCW